MVRNAQAQEKILEIVERQATIITRHLVTRTSIFHSSFDRTLQESIVYLSNSACRISSTYTCKLYVTIVSSFCNSRVKTLRLELRFYLQTKFISLGLELAIFTTNMCGQMNMLIQFELTFSKGRLHSTCGLEFQVTASEVLTVYRPRLT